MSDDWKNNYWFSLNNLEPIPWDDIPERLRFSDGSTRTDKSTFTEEEVKDAGYSFTDIPNFPDFNEYTHYYKWNGVSYEVFELENPILDADVYSTELDDVTIIDN